MTQTEYLVERGAPPLPKGWRYEVRLVPDYNPDRDRWYTIVKIRIQDEDHKILGQAEARYESGFYLAYATPRTIEVAMSAYRSAYSKPLIVPNELTSLKYKES